MELASKQNVWERSGMSIIYISSFVRLPIKSLLGGDETNAAVEVDLAIDITR